MTGDNNYQYLRSDIAAENLRTSEQNNQSHQLLFYIKKSGK